MHIRFAVNEMCCRSINEEVSGIRRQLDRGRFERTVEAHKDMGDVIQRYRQIESFFRQLQVSSTGSCSTQRADPLVD